MRETFPSCGFPQPTSPTKPGWPPRLPATPACAFSGNTLEGQRLCEAGRYARRWDERWCSGGTVSPGPEQKTTTFTLKVEGGDEKSRCGGIRAGRRRHFCKLTRSFKSCHASKNGSFTCYTEDRFLYMFHEVSKPRKTICALQSIGMGRVSTKLDRRVGPLGSPAVPALPVISWMNKSVVWCCLGMAQVSSCNGPSITRRNSSVGEKENGLPKKGALKPGMLLLRVAPWRDSQAGGELARKMPIKESKECMAPRCFDLVFKDAL
ncbi:uncharacterized protein LOC128134625 [Harpia harpyja]|uniref:uncharacterized protein LOC128134625 n=1 Tax=Harpia harpyja TaxID=202280 RepID=UPI0022B1D1FC|nr:uncharacterized protein LOC128134625 [Harpia harpyja]